MSPKVSTASKVALKFHQINKILLDVGECLHQNCHAFFCPIITVIYYYFKGIFQQQTMIY